jgi:uncharacterized protein (DUF4415 family)
MKKPSSSRKSAGRASTDRKRSDTSPDLSEIPELTAEQFARAAVRRGFQPVIKRQLTLRLDSDVIDWFRSQGRGYQTRMNTLLRAYMNESEKSGRPPAGKSRDLK